MRTSYLPTAAFWCACSMAAPYLKAAIPLTCDRFPPTVQVLTVNSRSPCGPWVQSCQILFPWQTYSTRQAERPCSCTQIPNNRMLVLGQITKKGKGVMWVGRSNISGVLQWKRSSADLGALDKVKNTPFQFRNICLNIEHSYVLHQKLWPTIISKNALHQYVRKVHTKNFFTFIYLLFSFCFNLFIYSHYRLKDQDK